MTLKPTDRDHAMERFVRAVKKIADPLLEKQTETAKQSFANDVEGIAKDRKFGQAELLKLARLFTNISEMSK